MDERWKDNINSNALCNGRRGVEFDLFFFSENGIDILVGVGPIPRDRWYFGVNRRTELKLFTVAEAEVEAEASQQVTKYQVPSYFQGQQKC